MTADLPLAPSSDFPLLQASQAISIELQGQTLSGPGLVCMLDFGADRSSSCRHWFSRSCSYSSSPRLIYSYFALQNFRNRYCFAEFFLSNLSSPLLAFAQILGWRQNLRFLREVHGSLAGCAIADEKGRDSRAKS
jgi:hypothetical protein